MSEQRGGGRYERSFKSLVVAMLVTVLAVVAFVLVRGALREDLDTGRPEAVDYLETVQQLQAAGRSVVYPPRLPEGWIVRDVDFEPGERPQFRLDLLTADGDFVGLRQRDADAEELVEEYVGEQAAEAEPLTDGGRVAETWQGWTEPGGDSAYTAQVGGDAVLAYGDVPAEELAGFVRLLSTAPLPPPPSPPVPSATG